MIDGLICLDNTRMYTLETLPLEQTFATLPEAFYARHQPTPFAESPYLVSFNPDAATIIGLDPAEAARPEFAGCFGGSLLIPGSHALAMLYAGHQFGVYVPQLGDGRALLLGEIRTAAGDLWDLHLKGAGRTAFSRDGDGRAVLRSCIREYLGGEAMAGLGIPTTRALSVVGSEEKVWRERVETGAMLLRLAPSHIRFGTFEAFYYRRQEAYLTRLADYVIDRHVPTLTGRRDRITHLFAEVVTRTARLIAAWQAVGFAHGVLNTDNMSIIGLTLDYGPFGFVDAYDPGFIPNHSDHHGRYALDQQPAIGRWNLSRLAQALLPLAPYDELKNVLDGYDAIFHAHYLDLMRGKLGFDTPHPEDEHLIAGFLQLLQASGADYTTTFRALADVTREPTTEIPPALTTQIPDRDGLDRWIGRYRERLREEPGLDEERRTRMNRVNPKYILRNYLAQQAIDQAVEHRDFSEIDRLRALLADPFQEHPDMDVYAAPPPAWAKRIIVSCSS